VPAWEITIPIDLIDWLMVDGRGYQTKANALLRHAMFHFMGKKKVADSERFQHRRKAGELTRQK
jgi:hypothetical protein